MPRRPPPLPRVPEPGSSTLQGRLWPALFLASSILYLALAGHAARVETPTVDEFAHLPAGCLYWHTGDFSLYDKNPPLAKLWMSLPVAHAAAVPAFSGSKEGWAPWEYGTAFMQANRASYFDCFFHARLMILPLGLLTGLLLFLWARRLYSQRTGAILASMFLLSPTLLAHGHLATIDAAASATILLALLALSGPCRRPGWRGAALAGAALGLALAVKYTALLLLPAAGLLFLRFRLFPSHGSRPSGWKPLLRDLGLLLLTALLALNLLMGFAGTCRTLGRFSFASSFMKGVQRDLPGWLPLPLPEAYVSGFDAQKLDTEAGEFGSYLLGRWSQKGWWSYNLFALLVKEPETFLLLLLAAPFFWRRRAGPRDDLWILLVPAGVLLIALSLFNRLDVGIRYLLPLLPLLYLLAGPAVEALTAAGRRWVRVGGTSLLLLYSAGTAVAVGPDYIGYFNPVSGGPARGSRLLLDSNIDWGQDLYRLPAELQRLGAGDDVSLLYFGHVDPGLYGLHYSLVPPQPARGIMAVSVNFLCDYPYVTPAPGGQIAVVQPGHLGWLRGRTPVARLGSIWVYDTRHD